MPFRPVFASLPPILEEAFLRPVAAGRERSVFEIEGVPQLLFKISRPHRSKERDANVRLREARTARLLVDRPDAPVARVFGRYPSELGEGILFEALREADGMLAPDLGTLVAREGVPSDMSALLTRFAAAASRAGLPIIDAGPQNLVVFRPPGAAARLLLVDGYGDRKWLPIYWWSARLRERQIRRRVEGITRLLGLDKAERSR